MSGHGESNSSILLMAIAAVTTAIFWGIYGPLLTWGHNAMTVVEVEGEKAISYGRLRPFICVGVAYLLVAVLAPAILIQFGLMEPGKGLFTGWSMNGIWWSLIAGGAGALGALFLLVALNYAPTDKGYPPPLLVMPLVFGCAPVVNALFSMWVRNKWNVNPLFLAGMILVAVGAVTVIVGSQINWGSAEAKESPPAKKPIEEKIKDEITEEKAATEK